VAALDLLTRVRLGEHRLRRSRSRRDRGGDSLRLILGPSPECMIGPRAGTRCYSSAEHVLDPSAATRSAWCPQDRIRPPSQIDDDEWMIGRLAAQRYGSKSDHCRRRLRRQSLEHDGNGVCRLARLAWSAGDSFLSSPDWRQPCTDRKGGATFHLQPALS
jgi:hypothetical protein